MPFVYIFFQASSGKCTSVVQGTLVLLYFILFGLTPHLGLRRKKPHVMIKVLPLSFYEI